MEYMKAQKTSNVLYSVFPLLDVFSHVISTAFPFVI